MSTPQQGDAMIGHYLNTLTEDQEERVLTLHLAPGSMDGPCLVGATVPGLDCVWTLGAMSHRGLLVSWGMSGVMFRYDALYGRFGPRANNAIRNRILSNQARRVLQNRPAHTVSR